jgi:photosystem II stability/assembly factor-like uncharacterized protein
MINARSSLARTTSSKSTVYVASAIAMLMLLDKNCARCAHVVAVGTNGSIRQSSDSGSNWFPRSSGTTETLYAVDCIAGHCWTVGAGGTILHSSDGGISWNAQQSDTTRNLEGVDFITMNHGWVVGDTGTILVTHDGGKTWARQDATSPANLRDVKFINTQTGWIAGNAAGAAFEGTIRHTKDGGANWSFETSRASVANILDLDFTSASKGWYAADGLIGHTRDGGTQWSAAVFNQRYFYAVDFINDNQGVVVGADFSGLQGVILFTDDGGLNWEEKSGHVFRDVSINEQGIGWAVGDGGIIQKTVDGGKSWLPQSGGATERLFGLAIFDIPIAGDYNLDMSVDSRDYETWRTTFGSISDLSADGNWNGIVDISDYVVWRSNLTHSSSNALRNVGVPEPSMAHMLAVAFSIIVGRRFSFLP